MQRGHNRQVVFASTDDFAYYIETLKHFKKEFDCKIYSYCLMTNHVHLIINPGDIPENSGDIIPFFIDKKLIYTILLTMARMKRTVVPGYPHHVVQRGVRSMDVFFSNEDRKEYLHLLHEQSKKAGVRYLAYCLMSNHIHLLAIPEKEDSLARAIGEAHRRYTRMINFRENVRGFLFQGRFSSCPVYTGNYLFASVRYIEQNPVKAKMAKHPWDYEWSSAAFHCGEIPSDPLLSDSSFFSHVKKWRKFLSTKSSLTPQLEEKIRTGRPFGPDKFYTIVEEITGKDMRPGMPGRPKKQ